MSSVPPDDTRDDPSSGPSDAPEPETPPPGFDSADAKTDYPVRARLLEKARMAGKGQLTDFGSVAASSPTPRPPASTSTSLTPLGKATPFGKAPLEAIDISDLASRPPPQVQAAHRLVEQVSDAPSGESAPSGGSAPSGEEDVREAPAEVTPLLPPARAMAPSVPPPPKLPPTLDDVPDSDKSPAPLLTPAPGDVMDELDRIARRSSVPRTPSPSLSPNLTALLGGLLGLTVIVTLGLFLGKSEGQRLAAAPQAAPEVKAVPEAKEPDAAPLERKKVEGPWRVMDDAQQPGNRIIAGKIGKLAFLTAIQEAGLPKNEAYRAYTALKGLLDLDHCKSNDQFVALVSGREKKLLGFEYVLSKEAVYQAKPDEAGHLQGQKLDLKVARNQIRRAFVHDGKSFEDSARRGGFDPGISDVVSSALRGHSALADFKSGDRMRIIVQEVTVLGEFSRYAGVEAMEILKHGKPSRRIYYYSHPVEGGHFDANGKAPYEGGWRKPIPDAPVTSKFNMKRMHPVLNKVMPHTGTDFGAPAGTPIGATSPGVVSYIGPAGPSGNLVKVKHDGGYESGYAHLSKFAEGLKVGDSVDRLQLVGYCGSTGRSTGPHLHFTMKKDGAFIDPESLNLDGMRVLAKSHRAAFAEVMAKYDPVLDAIPLPEVPAAATPAQGETPGPTELGAESEGGMEADLGDTPTTTASQVPKTSEAAPLPAAPAVTPAVTPAPTAASSPSPTPSGEGPAKKVAPSAIFLSDEELLKMQSRTDEGEVSQ